MQGRRSSFHPRPFRGQSSHKYHLLLDLYTPIFAHGQLYIALSHCTSKDRIKVLFPELSDIMHTTNIVYSEVIAGLINH
jgi:hypothetical protein